MIKEHNLLLKHEILICLIREHNLLLKHKIFSIKKLIKLTKIIIYKDIQTLTIILHLDIIILQLNVNKIYKICS